MTGTKLTRAAILAADDLKTETVEVPEWGGSVTVRAMNAAERDAFESEYVSLPEAQRLQNMRARLAAATIVDDSGAPMFSPEDAAALGKKSAAALSRVFAVASRLNGMTQQDVDELAGK